jgi:tetratricopeptide (TPR) repeat protein
MLEGTRGRLEPVGTITKYYSFVDEKTKSILNSLMKDSKNYFDFVERLSAFVLENEVPLNLAYLAAIHAWWCRVEDIIDAIQDKYNDIPCIRPWAFHCDSMERDQLWFHDSVVDAIEGLLDNSIADWMVVELHILHAFFHYPLGEVPSILEPTRKAKAMIDANSLLTCYEPALMTFEAYAKAVEHHGNEALAMVRKGKELAQKYDDPLYKYMNMLYEGNILRCVSVHDSIILFEELYDLADDLGVPSLIGEVLNDSSIVFETVGEYDLAISCHNEILKMAGGKCVGDTTYMLLSRLFNTLNDGIQAQEWIDRGFECGGPIASPTLYYYKAWSLALQDQTGEAERLLETAYAMLVKAGVEVHLLNYYHISGVVELRKGNLLAALERLTKAWKMAERIPRGENQNRILLDLARVEIALGGESTDDARAPVPGKWLSKVEDFALEKELPGLRMYAALLKSEFYIKHSQFKDALETLESALNITDSLGVKTLRSRISSQIKEIGVLIADKRFLP